MNPTCVFERKVNMGYIGEIGKRMTVTAVYKKSFEYVDYKFSFYGTTHFIHTFEDAEGNTIIWKSTNTVFYLNDGKDNLNRKGDTEIIPKGSTVELTGTVKDHSTYKDIEQTVVTRCKFKLISLGKTKEEIQKEKAEAQMATLTGRDFIWEMHYKQYKEHYSDCETIIGSYDPHLDSRGIAIAPATIKVIIREGRLKNSGVRGQHFFYFTFENGNKKRTYRAVCEANARKQLKKEFPDSDNWDLYNITKH
jgi:hypothetical protein